MRKIFVLLQLVLITAIVVSIYTACTKEYSYESGTGGTPAQGTIVKDSVTGDCQVAVAGTYYTGIAPTDSNYVSLQIDVTKAGSYKISTASTHVNFYFADSGILSGTGRQTIRLRAIGTPDIVGTTAFTVTFDTSICSFTVDVQDGSTIIDGLTKSDSAWHFQGGGTFYHGSMDTAFLFTDTLNNKHLAIVGGTVTKDSLFSLVLRLPTGGIMPGLYITNNTVQSEMGADFGFGDIISTSAVADIFRANVTTVQVVNIFVSSYDPVTRIIQGTFSGTAKKLDGNTAPVTGGKFIAKVSP